MMSLIAVAAAAEKKIKLQDMPAAVQQAVKDQSQGAVEASIRKAGKSSEFKVDANGAAVK